MKKHYYSLDIKRAIKHIQSWLEDFGSYGSIAAPLNVICRKELPVTEEQIKLATTIRDKASDICENFGEDAITKDCFVWVQSRALCKKVIAQQKRGGYEL
jgi:hypothetical protein